MGKINDQLDEFNMGSWYQFLPKGSQVPMVGKCIDVQYNGVFRLESVKLRVGKKVKTRGKENKTESCEEIIFKGDADNLKWAGWVYPPSVKKDTQKIKRNLYEEIYRI